MRASAVLSKDCGPAHTSAGKSHQLSSHTIDPVPLPEHPQTASVLEHAAASDSSPWRAQQADPNDLLAACRSLHKIQLFNVYTYETIFQHASENRPAVNRITLSKQESKQQHHNITVLLWGGLWSHRWPKENRHFTDFPQELCFIQSRSSIMLEVESSAFFKDTVTSYRNKEISENVFYSSRCQN